MAAKTPFARFLSSVEGHLVSRYGSATAKTAPTLIGARRTHAELVDGLSGQASIEWTDEIVSLTAAEAAAYKQEYDSAVREGALVERTEAEYLEQADAAQAKAVAAAKKLEAEQAEVAKPAPATLSRTAPAGDS